MKNILVIVSSPPGYFPDNLVATTPSYLPKTSTPYFTETLIPKRPAPKNKDPNREYSPKVPTTTQLPLQSYQDAANSGEYANQHVSHGSFGRVPPTSAVAYDPNVRVGNAVSSYFTPIKDRSQHNYNNTSVKLPDARLKVYG